jgi:hypothetical protein
MNTEFEQEITGIRMLNLLFFNYDSDMLEEMMNIREFKHCWENYVDKKEQTYMQIWEFYLNKISYKSQILLLEIANKYYGDEANESFANTVVIDKMLQARLIENTQE